MDEEVSRRLLDPFFTTKFTGRGLGMAAVKGIVQWHKGAIFVKSEPDQGTTVRILFPALKEVPAGAQKPDSQTLQEIQIEENGHSLEIRSKAASVCGKRRRWAFIAA
jgi:hypothetical protein